MSKEVENLSEKIGEADQDEVYCISSGDEDCSKGMKSMNYQISDVVCFNNSVANLQYSVQIHIWRTKRNYVYFFPVLT